MRSAVATRYAPPSCATHSLPPLWRNSAFVRVWAAATVSVFGSLVTRIALPLVAILVLGAGPVEVAILRSLDLVAALRVRAGRRAPGSTGCGGARS